MSEAWMPRIEVGDDGVACVLTVSGELDLSSNDLVESVLEAVRASGRQRAVVDLGGVTFADLRGLRPFLAAALDGLTLTVRNPSDLVERVIQLTELDRVL